MTSSHPKLAALAAITLIFSLLCCSANACTAIYVGSALTDDGATVLARSEDIANSYNKLYFVNPHGAHTTGETYVGCYGFTYTFTHDSYAHTGFSDDNQSGVSNVCPDCGETHAHTPYGAAGTNEMGVTVSATESIGCFDAIMAVDPYTDLGIEEAEIPTVLLSEAATAREALSLLTAIYDEAGCNAGSGIFIADDKECWYIENTSGHQYIALKLSDDLVFSQPNLSIIGLIDLDDTENVVASPKLIEVAQQAGTFVGDAEANVIDYLASYNPDQSANERMADALNYFNAANAYTADAVPESAAYTLSNVDAQGNIVPMHTAIALDKTYTIADVQNYYHIEGIGSSRNLETHIFQIYAEDSLTDTVEWVSMDDAAISPFIPYYPMLTTDVYAGYKLSTAEAVFTTDQPEAGLYYPTTSRIKVNGERVTVEGFKTLPENWADSYYWTIDALSNLTRFGGFTDEQTAQVKETLYAAQVEVNAAFADAIPAIAAAENTQAAAALATAQSEQLAADVHGKAVALTHELIGQ